MLPQESFVLGISFLTRTALEKLMHLITGLRGMSALMCLPCTFLTDLVVYGVVSLRSYSSAKQKKPPDNRNLPGSSPLPLKLLQRGSVCLWLGQSWVWHGARGASQIFLRKARAVCSYLTTKTLPDTNQQTCRFKAWQSCCKIRSF